VTLLLLCLSVVALCYCAYVIRKLKADVDVAVRRGALFLEYITEQRGACLHLVVESLEAGADPPKRASELEIKVARIIMSFPKSRKEMDAIWNWQPSGLG
jgi:hypothetical protein